MDLISATDTSVGDLRSAVVDWLSARQERGVSGAAEVAVAAALERVGQPPVICARLRRGVREGPVRAAFGQCQGEAGESSSGAVTLVIERHPIRRTLADEYCDLTTNDPAEHAFVLAEALQVVASAPNAATPGVPGSADRALAVQLAEIAVAFPAARESLEELLWQHCK